MAGLAVREIHPRLPREVRYSREIAMAALALNLERAVRGNGAPHGSAQAVRRVAGVAVVAGRAVSRVVERIVRSGIEQRPVVIVHRGAQC